MQPVRDYLQVVQVGEAASFLGVSPNTVRNWSRKGKIPTHRHPVNGYRLYKQEDLEALLLDTARPAPRRPVHPRHVGGPRGGKA